MTPQNLWGCLITIAPTSAVPLVWPNQTTSCSDHSFLVHLPPPTNSPMLSAWAGFPRPTTRPIFSIYMWWAACSTVDLPICPSSPATCSHYPLKWPMRPLHFHLSQGHFFYRYSGCLSRGKAAKGVVPILELRNQMLCPRRMVWHRPVLWVEKEMANTI